MIQLDSSRHGILFDVVIDLDPGILADKMSARGKVREIVEYISEALDLTAPDIGFRPAIAWCNERMLDGRIYINKQGELILEEV